MENVKERFIKKILENHLMWSGSNDRKPSEIAGQVECDYVRSRIEVNFGSMKQFYLEADERKEQFDADCREAFKTIALEADERWEKALEVMGL